MRRRTIISEHLLNIFPYSLDEEPVQIETPGYSIAVFYLPLQDPRDPPQKGKFGGDSFTIDRLEDDRLFVMLRNGVNHGGTGRRAIQRSDSVLEDIFEGKVAEDKIANIIQGRNLFERLDVLAYSMNELLNI